MLSLDRPLKETRRAKRRSLSLRAELRESGSARHGVDVQDLSETGFACDTYESLALGKTAFLHVKSFAPFPARVVWRRGTLHGFQFLQALHPAVVDTIAHRFRS